MNKLITIRNVLRLLTLVIWVVGLLWFMEDSSYEPLLAFVGGTATLIASFFTGEQTGGIRMKGVRAGRDVNASDKTGQGITLDDVEAKQDVNVDES